MGNEQFQGMPPPQNSWLTEPLQTSLCKQAEGIWLKAQSQYAFDLHSLGLLYYGCNTSIPL